MSDRSFRRVHVVIAGTLLGVALANALFVAPAHVLQWLAVLSCGAYSVAALCWPPK